MNELQASVSTLNDFRSIVRGEYWMTEEKLIKYIKREEEIPKTRAILVGIALGEILQKPEKYHKPLTNEYCYDGLIFPASVVDPCAAIFDRRGLFEVPQYTDFYVDGRQITVSGRADQILGNGIIENKVKCGYFDTHAYDESFQWRLYLPMFGAKSVRYNVFLLDDNESKGFSLRSIENATYYPYPELMADITWHLRQFAEWADRKGLGKYLVPSRKRPKPSTRAEAV